MVENRSYVVRAAAASDRAALEACFIQLQKDERAYEWNRRPGESFAPAYVDGLYRQCRESQGLIVVAESDSQVVGFVCVLARTVSGDMIEQDQERAYITDLVVLPGYRERGIGTALLAAAEAHAAQAGAQTLMVGVLAGNTPAWQLYLRLGFVAAEVVLRKPLR
jgi:ribosomal protein S18 acetylase RimI-like enzyme